MDKKFQDHIHNLEAKVAGLIRNLMRQDFLTNFGRDILVGHICKKTSEECEELWFKVEKELIRIRIDIPSKEEVNAREKQALAKHKQRDPLFNLSKFMPDHN